MKKLVLFLVFLCHYAYAQTPSGSTPDFTADGYTSKPIKIGDVLPIQIAPTHPYNATGGERLAFEQEFFNKNSSYIKLYFENFNLAPGDYVEIKGLNSGETVLYSELGKIIDENGQMLSNFWSKVIFDERVRVRLYTTHSSNSYGFDLTQVAYGYSEARINNLFAGKSICGTDDKEPIECYNGTDMFDKGRAVCRLIIGGAGSCTGWLLGCDGHIMTNEHCIGTANDASNTDFIFNFQHTNCAGTANATSDVVASSATFIKTNATLDYTLTQLIPATGRTRAGIVNTYGFLSLSSVAPVVNDRIYIVQHPGGRRKEIAVNTDQGGTAGGFAMINQINANGARYFADTEGGSSGSPVFNFNTNLVVAIHNTGGCTNGSFGRSDRLITAIGADMPSCGIDSSGTGVVVPSCNTTITSYPYNESFESNNIGVFTQGAADDIDWTVFTGATPSASTGPTTANDGQYYAYIEASTPNFPNINANLWLPCLNLNSVAYPQLVFDYHMSGIDMGDLSVEVSTNGVTWVTLWTRTGDQGTAWITDTVDLNAYTSETELRVRFNGVTGTGFNSDIAIDDVTVEAGPVNCNLISTFPYTEGFETGLGDWIQDTGDDFDWTRNSGATPSTGTGPGAASVGNFYMYTEATSPNNPNKTAYLVSPCFDMTNVSFPELTFDYHMLGAGMGTMNVEVSVGGGAWTSVWTLTGDQGTAWATATVDLFAYRAATDLRIRFNGLTNGFESDMAIDAVSIAMANLSCSSTITSYPYNEGFETGLGDWIQDTGDDFDWARNSGTTVSTGTGPTAATEGSFYMYTEASAPNNPSKIAILNSPCFDLTAITDPELTFNYHMFGNSMGSLVLEVRTGTTNWTTLWSRTGDQGNQWLQISINLQPYTSFNDVRFRFRGTTGTGFSSDMAIDGFEVASTTSINTTTVGKEAAILEVAPVPFNDYLEVHTNIQGILPYQITNVQGQVVKSGELKGSSSLQVSNLSTGVYFIRFNNGQEDVIKKIVKY
ncbi:MAG: trypsin-like peptidase domain-containing protein [Aureispira sp.]